MGNKPAKQSDNIRWPTVFVILVLASIGFILFWQFVLEGSLSRPTPEKVVREFLRLGLPSTDGFEITDMSVMHELPSPDPHVKSAVLRVRYRARDDLGRLTSYDRIFVVIGEQVKGAEDWSPELESQVHSRFEKLQPK